MQFKFNQAQTRISYLDGVCKEHEASAIKHSAIHKSTLDEIETLKDLRSRDSQLSLDQMTEQAEKSRVLRESLEKKLQEAELNIRKLGIIFNL
jgi:hypothetical protein